MFLKKDAYSEYEFYCDKFEKIAKEYKTTGREIYEEIRKNVTREEVCSGSDLFLGYYCPSPVFDLIVGNTHRGKILKRITKRTKPTHIYGFADDGRLLTVDDKNNYTRCFYLYQNDTVSIICRYKRHIDYVAECKYDNLGRIIKYTLGSLSDGKCDNIEQEIYTYTKAGIDTVTIWDCMDSFVFDEQYILQMDTYKMYHDNEGYLTKYEDINSKFPNTFFEIPKSKTRKI